MNYHAGDILKSLHARSFSAAGGNAPGPEHGAVLVCNKGDRTVGIIDPREGKEIATIPDSGVTVHEVVATPGGRTAFAPVYGNSGVGMPGSDGRTIDVIDVPARKRIHTIALGKPSRPHCVMINRRDGLVYVTAEIQNSVIVIDPGTFKVVAWIPTGQPQSHMLAIARDGKRAYTANVGPGTVSVLDLVRRRTLAIIPVARTIQRISVSMDGRYVFTADQNAPRLAVIDARANTVIRWILLPSVAFGTAPTLDGHWLMVTQPEKNSVALVKLRTMRVAKMIRVGRMPQEIIVTPDGSTAFVSCMASRQVAEIDLNSWLVERLIPAGRTCDGLAWAQA